MAAARYSRTDYNVAWICPLPDVELLPARLMLEEEHDSPSINTTYDENTYICGTIKGHRVVIATLPQGWIGNVSASKLAGPLFKSFPNIKIALLVGIGGGVPRSEPSNDPLDDVHLGDVVVGWPGDGKPGVIYHELGRAMVNDEFEIVGTMDKPEWRILNALSLLSSNREMKRTKFPEQLSRLKDIPKFTMPDVKHDRLFKANYHHIGDKGSNCESCDHAQLVQRPARTNEQRGALVFHQGRIATGNSVVRDGELRDKISKRCGGVLCVEMEAAGVEINGRFLVIRGISDYADSHKNDMWKHYAAGNAAAFARELLCMMQASTVRDMEGTVQVPWRVPFQRNQHFVGRESEIQALSQMLSSSETCERAAIWGLGGCGKTAIALEFAYRTRKQHPRCAVFWVPAISRKSFLDAYRDIGMLLQIPNIQDENADVKQLVQRELSGERSGQWLMVVDNADDVDVLFQKDPDGTRLVDYLPDGCRGSLLFTTRTRKAATDEAGTNIIPLPEMEQNEARNVLGKSLLKKSLLEDDAIDKLLEDLSYLPLAIVQAAAFINQNDISISKYMSLLQNKDEAIELLSENFEDHRRYQETKNPIATTWIISFDQIRMQDPLAARILSFISCILRENIPVSLLPLGNSEVEQTKSIGTLTAYAFITKREDQRQKDESYDTHRLVHLATQNWLKMNQQWTSRIQEVFTQLLNSIPYGNYDTREIWASYLPHALCVVTRAEHAEIRTPGDLLHRIGRCQDALGHYAAAEATYRGALQMAEKKKGKKNSTTLCVMFNLATALSKQSKFIEAYQIHQEVLSLRKKVQGRWHPDTLTSMDAIGDNLHYQKKYAEAEKMHRQVLVLRGNALGKQHYDTLTSMTGLARALAGQKKYAEAERLHREVLASRKKTLGNMNSETILSMNELAVVLSDRKKYIEAEEMHWNSLALHEEFFGEEHPETLVSMGNLADILCCRGNFIKGEEMDRKAAALSKNIFGREGHGTLERMNSLARTLSEQEKYIEAQEIYQEVLAMREKVLGKDHPDTKASRKSLRKTLERQGKCAGSDLMGEC